MANNPSSAAARSAVAAANDIIDVRGLVRIRGSAAGVPGLVVEVVGPAAEAERLGSAITDARGSFSIGIRRSRPKSGETQPLGIKVLLLTPDRMGVSRTDRVLYESEQLRTSGQRETLLIEVEGSALQSKGFERLVADDRPAAEIAVEAIDESFVDQEAIAEASELHALERMKRGISLREAWRDDVVTKVTKDLLRSTERERKTGRLVESAEEIDAKASMLQHRELARLSGAAGRRPGREPVKRIRRTTRLQLTDGQRKSLGLDAAPEADVTISQDRLERTLKVSLLKPPTIERSSLANDPCRPALPADGCLSDGPSDSNGGDGGDGADGGTSTGDAQPAAFDSARAVAEVMDSQTAPEDLPQFNGASARFEANLTADELPTALGGVTLTPGPADVPSFHDFSELQLAFESVWQEALDDRVFDDLDAAYDRIVEQGLTQLDDANSSIINIDTIILTLEGMVSSVASVPPEVAANVRISLVEYQALPATLRAKLDVLAGRIEWRRRKLISELLKAPENGDGDGGGGNGLFGFVGDLAGGLADLVTDPTALVGNVLGPLLSRFGAAALAAPAYGPEAIFALEQIKILQAQADRIVAHAKQLLVDRERKAAFRPTDEIIRRLRASRDGGYPFRYFAASPTQRSVNFGVMVTYRQIWTPVSYQVADLVSTIPLGPREARRYTKREVRKRRRSQRELEANLFGSKYDTQDTSRAENEILADAKGKTSFAHTAEGTFTFGSDSGFGGSAKGTASFQSDAESHSRDVKKSMREAVVKAAIERRIETKVEVDIEESFESESTESGELINPNDEITCTFLFYELQRRYRINERLHRLQSVVLVAQEMPRARDLDADWLIRHDWILRRVLLDDSFRPAFDYVTTTLASDRETLAAMRQALLDQQLLVEQIREDLADRRSLAGLRYASLERQIERTAEAAESNGGLWDTVSNAVTGGGLLGGILGGGEEGEDNAAKIREAAARDAWERERREEEDFRQRLMDAQSTLATMRSEYHAKLSTYLAELTQVERLSTHVFQNIMHYMQAIWAHEPDDQRFLRLREVPVPDLQIDTTAHTFRFGPTTATNLDNMVIVDTDYGGSAPPAQPEDIPTRPLAEVADLSAPLGFLGNYMMLAMYETNALTDFMMDPYVEFAAGEHRIVDPDPTGNMSLDEFSDYVCCLKSTLPKKRFDAAIPELKERLRLLLQRSVRDNEEIVVGTGNLYIEALPGTHSIVEQFKHLHRQVDVKSAQETLRSTSLDNIRRAQRILNNDLEDPEVKARYVFEGASAPIVAPPVPPAGPGGGG